MRVLVVDYAGHPFQYELSTELSRAGHHVTHSYCASLLTPQAAFSAASGPELAPIDFGRPFEKYSLIGRARDELRYGLLTSRLVRTTGATRLITSNVPLISLVVIWLTARLHGVRWLLWLQDIQSGLAAIVRERPDLVSTVLGSIERFLIRRADHVVAICDEFASAVHEMGVAADSVTTIENWAPIDQLPSRRRRNGWAERHELATPFVFLYSGTLGVKHSPHLLVALADAFIDDPAVRIVVVAEGAGADQLATTPRSNLIMLPFQPFEELPDVMSTADVLVTLLDPAAGSFSVPSKTLSYLCAGRAVLAAVPPGNAAARLISEKANAGITVDPADEAAFVAAAKQLRDDDALRAALGKSGRAYAEVCFDRTAIRQQFERLLERL